MDRVRELSKIWRLNRRNQNLREMHQTAKQLAEQSVIKGIKKRKHTPFNGDIFKWVCSQIAHYEKPGHTRYDYQKAFLSELKSLMSDIDTKVSLAVIDEDIYIKAIALYEF